MNPDDERMRNALHSIEPGSTAGDDVPDLFDRVAAGARHRRRVRSSATVAGGALVVAAIAAVPAMNLGSSPSHHVTPLGAPSSDVDPGFTGHSPPPLQASPSTTAGMTQPTISEANPSPTLTPAPTPLPTDAKGCPTVTSLPPGAAAEEQAKAAAVAAIPQRYGADVSAKGFTVTKVYPAAGGQGFGIVADAICGKALGDNSYVVELGFASNSASMGSGQLFVANFAGGWQVWFQYH